MVHINILFTGRSKKRKGSQIGENQMIKTVKLRKKIVPKSNIRNPDNIGEEKVYLNDECIASYLYDSYDPYNKKLYKRFKEAQKLCESHLQSGDSLNNQESHLEYRSGSHELCSVMFFFSLNINP